MSELLCYTRMSRSTALVLGKGISPVMMPAANGPIDRLVPDMKAGTKRAILEPTADRLFDMQNAPLREKRRRIDSGGGPTVPATGGPLDGKRTGVMTKPYPRTPLPPPQRVVNQAQPITRIVRRIPGMASLDTVAINQWVIIHSTTHDARAKVSEESRNTLLLQHEDGTNYNINLDPVTALSPSTWNFYMYNVQRRMFDANPDDFYALSASDIMKDWSWDGVCISEEMLNGAESQKTGGFGKGGKWKGGDGYKVITTNLRNECHCLQDFGGSVIEGGVLLAVLGKVTIPPRGFVFDLDRPRLGGSPSTTVGYASQSSATFKPFMIRLICVPDAQPLPIGYRMYTDELGISRPCDVTHLGRVLIAPQGNVAAPLEENPAYGPQPITSALGNSRKGLMKVLVNPKGYNPVA